MREANYRRENRRENYKSERDKSKMVWPIVLGNDETKRKKEKHRDEGILRLRMALCYPFLFLTSQSPEKLSKSCEMKCQYFQKILPPSPAAPFFCICSNGIHDTAMRFDLEKK